MDFGTKSARADILRRRRVSNSGMETGKRKRSAGQGVAVVDEGHFFFVLAKEVKHSFIL